MSALIDFIESNTRVSRRLDIKRGGGGALISRGIKARAVCPRAAYQGACLLGWQLLGVKRGLVALGGGEAHGLHLPD